ncbi:hypothetical protein [uncultured Tateyamaria sp.]|uniref:hypothetical protein n=1 Tax=uncultured Tateyamaria sp. TaxID=455651 RepID=UPI00263755B3|nr:hypothetical protein [uncultured Tateyamaria sp.]
MEYLESILSALGFYWPWFVAVAAIVAFFYHSLGLMERIQKLRKDRALRKEKREEEAFQKRLEQRLKERMRQEPSAQDVQEWRQLKDFYRTKLDDYDVGITKQEIDLVRRTRSINKSLPDDSA